MPALGKGAAQLLEKVGPRIGRRDTEGAKAQRFGAGAQLGDEFGAGGGRFASRRNRGQKSRSA
ncbi:MAG: hypothetical protein Q8L54_06375 [Devosia sp.]|nr:hypothetical protein [Devosia sp.]